MATYHLVPSFEQHFPTQSMQSERELTLSLWPHSTWLKPKSVTNQSPALVLFKLRMKGRAFSCFHLLQWKRMKSTTTEKQRQKLREK